MEKSIIKDVQSSHHGVKILMENEEEFLLSINSYTDGFYYPGKILSPEEYRDLKRNSKVKQANDYFLKLIAHHRYTHKQAYEKIETRFKLSYKEIELMLLPYVQAGILDDKAYAQDYLETKIPLGYGRKYLESQLRKKGIPETILKDPELVSLYQQCPDALEEIIAKADRTKKNDTLSQRKEKIYALLLRRGYSQQQSQEAIESFYSSFSSEEIQKEKQNQHLLLVREAEKCYNSLSRKNYDAHQFKDAFIRKLLSKGFPYSEIQSIINEKEYQFHD